MAHQIITSVNLSPVPFCSSMDSTRGQMSTKQTAQSLSHPNCEIPYVVASDWKSLSNSSKYGVYTAPKNGEVLFNSADLLFVLYEDGSFDARHIPPIKNTESTYAISLRNSLKIGAKFKAGDILYEYDSFRCGVPSTGYNTFAAYMPFFGMGHEDSIVVSEDFTYKCRHRYVDRVYLPIFEYSLLRKLYNNSIGYLPDIGDRIDDTTVASWLLPDDIKQQPDKYDTKSLKTKVRMLLQSMNLSDLINMQSNGNASGFSINTIRSNIEDGVVSGIKIHKLRKDGELIDSNLQQSLELLLNRYYNALDPVYSGLKGFLPEEKVNSILKQYYVYTDRDRRRNDIAFKDAVYLVEIEISDDYGVSLGDKVSSRHASKGVVSLILPSELRPITAVTKQPIDYIYNPFGVFSRMNLSQLLECVVSKSVWQADTLIKENSNNLIPELTRLAETTLKYTGDNDYYERVKDLTKLLNSNSAAKSDFLDQVVNNNLYVEVPSFAKIDLNNLLLNTKPKVNEDIIIPEATIKFMQQKLNVFKDYVVTGDMVVHDIFCSSLYIQKLNKIAEKSFNARDIGAVKSLTGQPQRGRRRSGGSKLGQMEVEAILGNGLPKTLKEFFTVKNDWTSGKKPLINSLVLNGKYQLPETIPFNESRTKAVVNSIIKYLKE